MSVGRFSKQWTVNSMAGRTGRWGGALAIAFLWILMGPTTLLRAQGVRYDNIVLGPRGGPVASATVAVCAAGASTSSTPCSPLATIYADEGLTQPVANPFQVDSLGNYGFWAAPGHYIVQIYGAGVTTRVMNVFLPCDPSNCSMSNATFSSISAGTLNLTGSLTVNGRPVATEPTASDSVIYVSPNGSDTNDGLSWGSAKQTLYAAVSAIEQSSSGGGTVYVAANTACGGPVSGQGLWLIGAGDPNYGSPPSGWIQTPHPLRLVGVGVNGTTVQNALKPQVSVHCGGSGDNPPLWISGTNTFVHVSISNLNFSSAANNAAKIGIASNGSRTATQTTGVYLNGDSFEVQNTTSSSVGPAMDIGANTFWIWIMNCAFEANASAAALSDQHQGIIVNPTGGASSGLITISHTVINNGGIHFYGNGTNAGSLTVDDLTTESQNDGSPAVWITPKSDTGYYTIRGVTVADTSVNPTYAVKLDGGVNDPGMTVVAAAFGNGRNTSGAMTLLSQYDGNLQNTTTDPYLENQLGFEGEKVYGQTDAGRRLFAPTASPWANVTSQIPADWAVYGNGGTITRNNNAVAPDGTDMAMSISESGGSGLTNVDFLNQNVTYAAGDYVIAGVWYRGTNGDGYAQAPAAVVNFNTGSQVASLIYGCSGGAVTVGAGAGVCVPHKTGGEWEWGSLALKVTTAGTYQTVFGGATDAGNPIEFYAPILLHVPAGEISDNDAAEIAANLASYPNSLAPPVEATLRGHPFAFGGSSDNYFATLDHTALTANRTYDFPDTGGTVCLETTCGSQAGQIAISSATSGSQSFGTTYHSAPICIASPTSNPGSTTWWVTSSTSKVTVTLSASDTITFNYSCFGHPN